MADRTCSVDECSKQARCASGLCPMHYQRVRNHGSTEPPRPPKTPGPCGIDGCTGQAGVPGTAWGWCGKHYRRWRKTGDPLGEATVENWRGPCSVESCCNIAMTRELCEKHYMRWLTHGTTDLVAAWANAPEGQKWCPVCRAYKPNGDFNRNRTTRDGLQAECRACGRRRGADWRKRNPDVIAAQAARRPRERLNEQARRSARKRRAEGRMPKNDRRARIRRVEHEQFSSREIAERDRWLCQICLGKGHSKAEARIPRSLRWPEERSLSIDHIVPLARGGNHTRANVQATHLRCNLRKKVKGTDQLRLFG